MAITFWPTKRFFDEPIKNGPNKGIVLDREKWDKMLDEYYKLHIWDVNTGWQTRNSLEKLGLEEVADELEKANKLPSD